jgi:glycosyltransferase involved in cell wall biosynthesis
MNVEKPLISVLIGSKDRPDALVKCIQSVLTQTYTEYEILVLDDNSKEPFAEYVRDKCPDNRIQFYHSEKTLGVAGGRNVIIRKAKGDYLLTLDDDAAFRDIFHSKLSTSSMAKRRGVGCRSIAGF